MNRGFILVRLCFWEDLHGNKFLITPLKKQVSMENEPHSSLIQRRNNANIISLLNNKGLPERHKSRYFSRRLSGRRFFSPLSDVKIQTPYFLFKMSPDLYW